MTTYQQRIEAKEEAFEKMISFVAKNGVSIASILIPIPAGKAAGFVTERLLVNKLSETALKATTTVARSGVENSLRKAINNTKNRGEK